MNAIQQTRLQELENIIEQSWVQGGKALLEIRNDRLYQQTHDTFEAYCRDRWGMAHNYADKLIRAVAVIDNLGTTVPLSERQLRPLTRLEPQEQREIWDIVTKDNDHPTARQVEEVLRQKREYKPAERPVFNQVNDNIGWARWSWNPVTGCKHDCPYCYARD